MYRYGRRSLAVIEQLPPEYKAPLMDVIKIVDISLLEAIRLKDKQNAAVSAGASTVLWPNSAHNILYEGQKARGFDAMPWYADKPGGIDWRTDKEFVEAISRRDMDEAKEILENIKRIHYTTGVVRGVFRAHGIILINGNDWDGDNEFDDHNFTDSPHYQEITWKKKRHYEWRIYKDE